MKEITECITKRGLDLILACSTFNFPLPPKSNLRTADTAISYPLSRRCAVKLCKSHMHHRCWNAQGIPLRGQWQGVMTLDASPKRSKFKFSQPLMQVQLMPRNVASHYCNTSTACDLLCTQPNLREISTATSAANRTALSLTLSVNPSINAALYPEQRSSHRWHTLRIYNCSVEL